MRKIVRTETTDAIRFEVTADSSPNVTVFSEETPLELIELIRPDVLVKGGDYAIHEVVGRAQVEAYGGRVELVPVVEGFSTSDLVRRIVEKYNGE